jgi:hypothetical protein
MTLIHSYCAIILFDKSERWSSDLYNKTAETETGHPGLKSWRNMKMVMILFMQDGSTKISS